jgi:Tol biopolymer transport system component
MLALAPALSPPRSPQIAFQSYEDGNSEIYLLDASSGILLNLTRHAKEDSRPAWSPDGRWIAFASNRTDNYEIYVMDASGGHLQNLTRHASDDFEPAWSPDGANLAFVSRRDGNSELYIMDVVDILANPACAALPDAFFVNQYQPCAPPTRRLTTSDVDETAPAWSPDGRYMAYVRESDQDSEIVTMRVNCTDAVHGCPTDHSNLTSNPARDRYPAWSPDGRFIAFASNRAGPWDIYLMRADGSQVRALTNGRGASISPVWSPDGQRIAFAGRRSGQDDIYMMNADGSDVRPLTVTGVVGFRLAWRP